MKNLKKVDQLNYYLDYLISNIIVLKLSDYVKYGNFIQYNVGY